MRSSSVTFITFTLLLASLLAALITPLALAVDAGNELLAEPSSAMDTEPAIEHSTQPRTEQALIVLPSESAAAAEAQAERLADQWDVILTNIVRDGLVDYSRAAKHPGFTTLIEELRQFDSSALNSRDATKAHLINLYNAMTVDLIVQHYPVSSIKRIGGWFSSPWDIEVAVFDQQKVTLDDIEHKLLRPMGDPRIHFAINCASISCPVLLDKAFRALLLNQQLDEQRDAFLQSPRGVAFANGKLEVSKIFRWFNEDWGGKAGVLKMLKQHHAEGARFSEIDGYLQYDWSLNKAEPAPTDIIAQ